MYSDVLLRRENKCRGNRKKTTWLTYAQVPVPQKRIKRDKSLRDGPVEKIPGGKREGGGENIKNAHARQVAQGEKKITPRYFLDGPALTGKKGCSG